MNIYYVLNILIFLLLYSLQFAKKIKCNEYISSLETWFPCYEIAATPSCQRSSLGRQRTADKGRSCWAPYLHHAYKNRSSSFTQGFALHPTSDFLLGGVQAFCNLLCPYQPILKLPSASVFGEVQSWLSNSAWWFWEKVKGWRNSSHHLF